MRTLSFLTFSGFLLLSTQAFAQGPMSPSQPQQQPQQSQGQPQQYQAQPQPQQRPEEERRAPNTIYVEGLGAGLFYSVNYERLVLEDLAVRVGVGVLSLSASASTGGSTSSEEALFLNFPFSVSYLGLGSDRHIFEVGAGLTINYTSAAVSAGVSSASGSGLVPVGTVFAGYRIHPFGRAGFNFRVGAMALIAQGLSLSNPDPESVGVLPWFYISAGASF